MQLRLCVEEESVFKTAPSLIYAGVQLLFANAHTSGQVLVSIDNPS